MGNDINYNESWFFHRDEMDITQDGVCNVYVLLDGRNCHCYGQEVCKDLPATSKIIEILKNARVKNRCWPKQILISKKDPYLETLKSICADKEFTSNRNKVSE